MNKRLLSQMNADTLTGIIDERLRAIYGWDSPRLTKHAMIQIIEGIVEDGEVLVNSAGKEEWTEVEFEVALDSGSIVHICSEEDAPGYILQESAGSKRGQTFVVGDGGVMANLGEMELNLSEQTGNEFTSTFQIAKVTRPLMTVGKICDEGYEVVFDKNVAKVVAEDGEVVCQFNRQDHGLYTAKLRLKAPFARHG